MKEANSKHEHEIQELRNLHEDQTEIWKQEAKTNFEIMVTTLKEKIESLKYQLNENPHATKSFEVFKDQDF